MLQKHNLPSKREKKISFFDYKEIIEYGEWIIEHATTNPEKLCLSMLKNHFPLFTQNILSLLTNWSRAVHASCCTWLGCDFAVMLLWSLASFCVNKTSKFWRKKNYKRFWELFSLALLRCYIASLLIVQNVYNLTTVPSPPIDLRIKILFEW